MSKTKREIRLSECDEIYYYRRDLDKVRGAMFIGWTTSYEGYTILFFKKDGKLIAVFDY